MHPEGVAPVALITPPPSGSVDEVHFGAPGGERRWFMFSPPESEPWAGDFRADGMNHRYGACLFADGRTALVIAHGRGYIVDLHTRGLLQIVREDLFDALTVPARDFVIAHNYTSLFAYGRGGEVWRSERVALDGIGIDEVTPSGLAGQAYLPKTYDDREEWKPFRLSFDGWVYSGATYALWRAGKL